MLCLFLSLLFDLTVPLLLGPCLHLLCLLPLRAFAPLVSAAPAEDALETSVVLESVLDEEGDTKAERRLCVGPLMLEGARETGCQAGRMAAEPGN